MGAGATDDDGAEPLEVIDLGPSLGTSKGLGSSWRPRLSRWRILVAVVVAGGVGGVIATAARSGNDGTTRGLRGSTTTAARTTTGLSTAAGASATIPEAVAVGRPDIGRVVFTRGGRDGGLYVLGGDGVPHRITTDPGDDAAVWSPNGRRIAFIRYSNGNANIWVVRANGAGLTQLTNDGKSFSPTWSPDGSRILFLRSVGRGIDFDTMRADGTDVRELTRGRMFDASPTWSPDGTKVAFVASGQSHLYVMNADGSHRRRLGGDLGAGWPSWSPDGRTIAFVDENNDRIDVISPDGTGLRQVFDVLNSFNADATAANFTEPTWSPDGASLVFSAGNGYRSHLYQVNVDGSQLIPLTTGPVDDQSPNWSRVPRQSR